MRGLDVAHERGVVASHDGRFRVSNLAPGSYRVQVVKSWEQINHSQEIRLTRDRDVVIDIKAARIAGRVIDELTLPSRLTIGVVNGTGGTVGIESQFLDASGRARFTTIPAGTGS